MLKKSIVASAAAALLISLSGCATRSLDTMSASSKDSLSTVESYKNAAAGKPGTFQTEADRILAMHIDVSFYEEPVSSAVKKVSEYLKIGFDTSFIPADRYVVNTNYKGSLEGFLDYVYRTTGRGVIVRGRRNL